MQTITATTMRNNLATTLNQVDELDYLLIARNDKIKTALVNIDFFEDLLALSKPEYLKSIKKARLDYQNKKTFSHQDVFGEL